MVVINSTYIRKKEGIRYLGASLDDTMYTKLYIFLPAYKIPNTEKVILTELFVIAMISDKMSLSACALFSMWILNNDTLKTC